MVASLRGWHRHLTVMVRWEMLVVHGSDGRCAREGCTRPAHRTAPDIESELSLLRAVREVLVSRGAIAPGPAAVCITMHTVWPVVSLLT